MKNFFYSLLIACFAIASTTASDPVTAPVKVDESSVSWFGKKITGKHSGQVNLAEGSLIFEGDILTGGSFVIDMPSIIVTDLEGDMKGNLEGHLKSDDFFGVENFPTATLEIKRAVAAGTSGDYKITADMTIKGITKEIKFYSNLSSENRQATAELTIDRTDFNVRYGSGAFFDNLGDKAIYDEFKLSINIAY